MKALLQNYKVDLPELLGLENYVNLSNDAMISAMPKEANIKLLEDIENYEAVCFNYVFGPNLESCQDAEEILKSYYTPVPLSDVQKGDVISYHYKGQFMNYSVHFGFVEEANGTFEGIRIKSKFGQYGVYYHDLISVPKCYGNFVIFWRKKEL